MCCEAHGLTNSLSDKVEIMDSFYGLPQVLPLSGAQLDVEFSRFLIQFQNPLLICSQSPWKEINCSTPGFYNSVWRPNQDSGYRKECLKRSNWSIKSPTGYPLSRFFSQPATSLPNFKKTFRVCHSTPVFWRRRDEWVWRECRCLSPATLSAWENEPNWSEPVCPPQMNEMSFQCFLLT